MHTRPRVAGRARARAHGPVSRRRRAGLPLRTCLQASETPRDEAFCSYVALHKKPLVTLDATRDPRFSDNPLLSTLGIRYYAGMPIFAKGTNQCLGTVCVIDTKPHKDEDPVVMSQLKELAREASSYIAAGASSSSSMEEPMPPRSSEPTFCEAGAALACVQQCPLLPVTAIVMGCMMGW